MSALPLVEEFVVVACESTDDTKKELERLRDENPKIKLIDSDWNVIKKSGSIMSEKTNIAIKEITGDYGLYVQCDEGIHEKDYDKITRVLEDNINNIDIKGFVFDYIHFFGGYFSYAKKSEKKFFYDKEVRIIRNDGTVFSWGDAMGFKDAGGVKINIENKNAVLLNANMFHYGRAKNPAGMYKKDREMERLYNFRIINRLKNWVSNYDPRVDKYIYSDFSWLERIERKNIDFHPAPFRELASKQDWDIDDFKTFMKEKKGTSQFFKMLIYRLVKDLINETSNAAKKIKAFLKLRQS
ncbi:MAG: glycosyltransferase [Deltaproteobacteria bacterium]|nr:glycosyltransferase [Deltaproteobacteria bacterium]